MCDISKLYFSYKTNVNIQFETEARVELPGVTLCTNTSYVIESEYLRQSFGSHLVDTEERNGTTPAMDRYLRNLTLGEQLLNGTVGGKKFFKSCKVMKPISMDYNFTKDYIQCETISKYVESITYQRKCYTISSQLKGESDDNYRIDHDIAVQDNAFPLYFIHLNHK